MLFRSLEPDEAQERDKRNDFMSTVSNFMNAVKNISAIAPEMFPVALEMLSFTVRGFSVARSLEVAIEDASDAIKKRLAQPQDKGPSDSEVKMMLEKMKQAGETQRLQFKEDAATDREELKTSLALVLQNLENKIASITAGTQALDQVMDADTAQDQAQTMPPQGAV